jgi:hypothetical protein
MTITSRSGEIAAVVARLKDADARASSDSATTGVEICARALSLWAELDRGHPPTYPSRLDNISSSEERALDFRLFAQGALAGLLAFAQVNAERSQRGSQSGDADAVADLAGATYEERLAHVAEAFAEWGEWLHWAEKLNPGATSRLRGAPSRLPELVSTLDEVLSIHRAEAAGAEIAGLAKTKSGAADPVSPERQRADLQPSRRSSPRQLRAAL